LSLDANLELLRDPTRADRLTGIVRGIEKESLRVDPSGRLAQTPHPKALGSALTHPSITTDFSEALLEFITAPSSSADSVLNQLEEIHRITYQEIGDELLWVNSMPCQLGADVSIPVGQYGSSNIGTMKSVYRQGLGHRYGRLMQTIAGIHYNFSVPDSLWEDLKNAAGNEQSLQDFKSDGYFSLIRNFRRYSWLLLYLLGAAPAVCRSFVSNQEHQLTPFGADSHSLYQPYATSYAWVI
jgi:glutamate--cysteine ligase